MSRQADADLAAAVAAGVELAACQIDAEFRVRIAALARRRGIPSTDAEDIAQDALLEVFRQLKRGAFRGESALSSWVYRIASGAIVNHWRSRGKRAATEIPLRPDSEELTIAASSIEQVAVVSEALSRMSPADRAVLLWHEQEGRTLKDIGRMFGIGTSAAGDRLTRARNAFRDAITGNSADSRRLKD